MVEKIQNSLQDIYKKLFDALGPRGWWPAKTPFEVMVGAVLTQAVAWRNVEKAIANLESVDLLTPEKLYGISTEKLEELLRPTRYYKMKTRKLQALVRFVVEEYQSNLELLFAEDLNCLRKRMLGVYGLGPETVDSILLYAGKLPVFVVDEYTRRIFFRLGWVDQKISYSKLQEFFMGHLAPKVQLYNEFHALIVGLGNQVCHTDPQCPICPLIDSCQYFLTSTQTGHKELPTKAAKFERSPNKMGKETIKK
jgi:endonuclease III related protein